MYHPMLCFLADATLPPSLSDFRLPSCDLVLEAVSNACSRRSHRRLTKHSLHVPQSQGFIYSYACLDLFLQCCLSNLKMFFAKPFLLTSRFISLIIRGISPFSSTPVCVFVLFYPQDEFLRLLHPPGPWGQPDACSLLFFANLYSICWRWRLCIFLTFSHSINSLYPIWIIGKLTAIWKSRWCFPDLPPPFLSWLKGN